MEHEQERSYSPFAEVWERIEQKIERTPKLADIWRPHEGPQKRFFESRAYEVLYGGAAAGGKSDALLYDGLQQVGHPNYKALLLRRSFPELRELIDRSMETFPKLGGKWNEQQKRWTFPSGSIYEMGYCETYADVMRYQGQEYCVAGGTPILMADGSHRNIERVEVGDLVQTLEGPKPVTRTHSLGPKPCVRAIVRDASGAVVGEQVHPVTHPVLTPSGWDSYASLAGGRSGYRASADDSRESVRPRALSAQVELHEPSLRSMRGSSRSALHAPATQSRFPDRPFQSSLGKEANQTASLRGSPLPPVPWQSLPGRGTWQGVGESACALLAWQTDEGSQGGYQSGRDSRDVRTPAGPDSDLAVLLAPNGVGESFPGAFLQEDGLGRTQLHSHPAAETYEHPYTGEVRPAVDSRVVGAIEMLPVGDVDVYDLTVQDANHYITACALVNKNTWIGFDEIGHIYEERIWTFLMSRNRSGAKGLERYMRASANPGGPGHGWLKRRFISTCKPDGTPYEIRMRTGETMTRAFYQALLKDNPTILQNDPGYASRLEMLPEVEYKWLAEGDWNAGAGMALGELQRSKHYIAPFEIPSHWTFFGSFDWGYNHPFSFGLFACDEDGNTYLVDSVQGRRLKPDEIVHRITDTLREKGYDPRALSHIAAGHDCWADRKARGELVPTIAEQFYELGLELTKANISRISGVQNLRRYLSWKTPTGEEFTPKFRIFNTLANARVFDCLESRVSDPDNIEDVLKTDASEDGEGGDDAYDMVRYGLASRPYSAVAPLTPKLYSENQDLNEFDDDAGWGTSTMAQFGRAWA